MIDINKFFYIFCFVIFFTNNSFSAQFEFDQDDPTIFKVKPMNMQLCEDWDRSTGECVGDNTYTITKTLTADDGRCDIAGVAPNAIACNYGSFNNPKLPSGVTYSYIRTELSRSMWLKGTVTNTNDPSVSGVSQCHTDGSHTQANNSQNAEGNTASDFTPTLQKFNFVNGPGNEATIAAGLDNGTKTAANTNANYFTTCINDLNAQACYWNTVPSLVTQGATHFGLAIDGNAGTANWLSKDYYMHTPYYASTEHIWMSDLDEADTTLVLMYVLETPYLTKPGVTPTLKMSFSVKDALDADFFKSEVEGEEDVASCALYVGSPGVSMSLFD